jgi:hypothetical protein
MSLSEFRALEEEEKKEAILQGTHIATRYDEYHSILLFQIGSFYVEVFYHLHLQVIRKCRPFNNVNQLCPYLRQIDISGILNCV